MGTDIHVAAYKLSKTDYDSFLGQQLSIEEYEKLTKAAVESKDSIIALAMQILSITDIRVKELFSVTVESLETGCVEVFRGSECVKVVLPENVISDLRCYVQWKGYKSGIIFRTRRGNPVDRFWLWKKLKGLCVLSGVDEKKVSFQNLKRPLGKEYYPLEI